MPTRLLLRSLAMLLVLVSASAEAGAEDGVLVATDPDVFGIKPSIDYPLLGAGLTLFLVPQLLQPELPADFCAPCDPSDVNWLDRKVIGRRSEFADVASDVLAVALPVGAATMSYVLDRKASWLVAEDLLLIVESTVLAGVVNQLTRHAFVRPRPFMYLDPVPDYRRNSAEDWHSFFSGHTSAAFAVATSFAKIQSARRPNSKWKPWIWVASMGAASLMPAFRLASGEHFPTDVVTGAAVGIAAGFVVPALHERERQSASPQLVVGRGFYGLQGQW